VKDLHTLLTNWIGEAEAAASYPLEYQLGPQLHQNLPALIQELEAYCIEQRIDQTRKIRDRFKDYMLPEDEGLFDEIIATLQSSIKEKGQE